MAEKERFIGIYQVHGVIQDFQTETSGEAYDEVSKGLYRAHQSFPYADLDGVVFKVTNEKPLTLVEVVAVEYPSEIRPE